MHVCVCPALVDLCVGHMCSEVCVCVRVCVRACVRAWCVFSNGVSQVLLLVFQIQLSQLNVYTYCIQLS